MVQTREGEEHYSNEVQCLCGQYHTDREDKLGIIKYSAQQGSEIIERGILYICPDCELMPGLNIDWYRSSPLPTFEETAEDE
jgi:hypothetical protein